MSTNVSEVGLTGPWANNWNPDSIVEATDNGDGTWTVTQPMLTENIEYLWVVNGEYENLIQEMQSGGDCAPVTDYANYANRVWELGTGNQTVSYGQCDPCTR